MTFIFTLTLPSPLKGEEKKYKIRNYFY